MNFCIHIFDDDKTLLYCSEAQDFLHYNDDGSPPALTGMGFCLHKENLIYKDTFSQLFPPTVYVPYPGEDITEFIKDLLGTVAESG